MFVINRTLLIKCNLQRRSLLGFSRRNLARNPIRSPTQPTKSWERSAKLVKDTKCNSDYIQAIRETHDPSLHVKTIEEELIQTMGEALGKQGEKLLSSLRKMDDCHAAYLIAIDTPGSDAVYLAENYNEHRENAMQARWELIVHRQAIGFTVHNHKFVVEQYPIPDALPLTSATDNEKHATTEAVKSDHADTGQLDWWERVGRWR